LWIAILSNHFETSFLSEPVLFFTILGWSVIYGAEITTNLMMWKICRLQLNHSEEICQNLTAGNETITISSFSLPNFILRNTGTGRPRYMREIGTPKICSHIMNSNIERPTVTVN